MRYWRAAIVGSIGLLLVGAIFGCTLIAFPRRPELKNWWIYLPLLLGPYFIAAIGCLISEKMMVRFFAVLTIIIGVLIAVVLISEAMPTIKIGPPFLPPPAVLTGMLLIAQYAAGIVAVSGGIVEY